MLIEDDLYGASAPELLARLRDVPEDTPSVILVGHNPGARGPRPRPRARRRPELIARVHTKFPTGALATLTFPGPWKSLGWGAATLEAFVVPADLP